MAKTRVAGHTRTIGSRISEDSWKEYGWRKLPGYNQWIRSAASSGQPFAPYLKLDREGNKYRIMRYDWTGEKDASGWYQGRYIPNYQVYGTRAKTLNRLEEYMRQHQNG